MVFSQAEQDVNNPYNAWLVFAQLNSGVDGAFQLQMNAEPGYDEIVMSEAFQAVVDALSALNSVTITESYRSYGARQDVTPTGA